ncbi:MAG: hypothetical protein ABR586_01820 [Thermoplasmatota archaeon]
MVHSLPPAAILLLCGCLSLLPAATPDGVLLHGEDGHAVDPDCAPDNGYEHAGVKVADGETTLFLPNDGCAAEYGVGALPGGPFDDTLRYQTSGQKGSICGSFALSGRLLGEGPWTCAAPGTWLAVHAEAVAGNPGARLVLTWKTDGLDGHANAFLESVRISPAA